VVQKVSKNNTKNRENASKVTDKYLAKYREGGGKITAFVTQNCWIFAPAGNRGDPRVLLWMASRAKVFLSFARW
jgi:hypothetical protein